MTLLMYIGVIVIMSAHFSIVSLAATLNIEIIKDARASIFLTFCKLMSS